jgi:hypothetical protein
LKGIEEHTRRQKDLPCSCISTVNMVKVVIWKGIYRFNPLSIKLPMIWEGDRGADGGRLEAFSIRPSE